MTGARLANSVEAVVQGEPRFRTFVDLAPIGAKYSLATWDGEDAALATGS